MRDRTERIRCQGNTIAFIIRRHPGPIAMRQRRGFNLENGSLSLIKEEPTYLDCEEVAGKLGVTYGIIRRYIRQGRLKAQQASEIESIDGWFDGKKNRGNIDLYIRRHRIIQPNKWLVPIGELRRFKSHY